MPTTTPESPAPAAPETLADLLRRFGDSRLKVPRIKFDVALERGDDPFNMIPYLTRLGHRIGCLDDLLAINDDPEEEELHCFPVVEGIAVSMASDRMWLLFERGGESA